MRTLFTTILLLSTLTILCQTNSKNSGKWEVGVTIAPDIYFNSESFSLTEETGFYSIEASGFNFTSGLIGEWSFNSKFDIVSGINYSRKDFSGRYYCNVCEFLTIPEREPMNVRLVEIPVFVRYNIFDKKFGVHIEAGITSGYLTNTINSSYTGTLSANKFQLSGLIGLGINHDLSQRINLSLSSDFRQSFTNLLVGSNLKFRCVGFITGITYKIN
ncbi:MAG: outer membrane beta-barrel protein [Bacteroidales bacterium]